MDLAQLETDLPAQVIAAVATTPHGLTTAATQVYWAEISRQSAITSPQVRLRWVDQGADGPPALARHRVLAACRVALERADMTAAQRRDLCEQLVNYFHGWRRPASTATRLRHWTVENVNYNPHEGEDPDGTLLLDLVAHGEGDDQA